MPQSLHDFKVRNALGKEIDLKDFAGKAVLVVNVASKCGFTPQYGGLESLYQKYKEQGLEIIGFPCNQFGEQEPGSNEEIQQFCKTNYGVTFPILAKVDVNGRESAPVYEFLKSSAPGILGTEAIKWNFTKFLIGKDGKVLKRFAPQTQPTEISSEIEKALR